MEPSLADVRPVRAVALVRLPQDAGLRHQHAVDGTPCLLVIRCGASLPVLGDGEDWVFEDADERDVAARIDGLRRSGARTETSGPVVVPSDLHPDAHRMAVRLLAAAGAFVPRSDLPFDDVEALAVGLGPHLRSEGWILHRIGDAGFLLDRLHRERR